jgi:hypothetical protein
MKVITSVVNNPIFIEIQYYTLKKYMKCDYEFIVFNDAKDFPDYSNGLDASIKNIIEQTCSNFKIKCINIPNAHHKLSTRLYQEPSYRTAEAMNFILDYQKKNPDKYLLLDSDMFLIDDFTIDNYKKNDCGVVLQKRNNLDGSNIHYIWNGLYYFDMNKLQNIDLMNWHCTLTTDTGGMMYRWLLTTNICFPDVDELKNNDNIVCESNGIKFIKFLKSLEWNRENIPVNIQNKNKLIGFLETDPRNIDNNFYCEIYDNKFLHYRGGGNWEKRDFMDNVKLSYKLKAALLQ